MGRFSGSGHYFVPDWVGSPQISRYDQISLYYYGLCQQQGPLDRRLINPSSFNKRVSHTLQLIRPIRAHKSNIWYPWLLDYYHSSCVVHVNDAIPVLVGGWWICPWTWHSAHNVCLCGDVNNVEHIRSHEHQLNFAFYVTSPRFEMFLRPYKYFECLAISWSNCAPKKFNRIWPGMTNSNTCIWFPTLLQNKLWTVLWRAICRWSSWIDPIFEPTHSLSTPKGKKEEEGSRNEEQTSIDRRCQLLEVENSGASHESPGPQFGLDELSIHNDKHSCEL